MNRRALAGVVAVLLASIAGPAAAQLEVAPVVGTWQVADPLDGGIMVYAIAPDDNGGYTVHLTSD